MIEYDVSDGLCVLRLAAPPLNMISLAMLDELKQAIDRAASDDQVRAVVLFGDSRHFSAGADIHLFNEIETDDDATRVSRLFQEAFSSVESSPKPVTVALAGKVLGGALELAMACHDRVCASDTRFSMPEVRLGINPGAGGTQRLPRLIGPRKALDMMLTGRSIDAAEALDSGLVDAVCDANELLDVARSRLDATRVGNRPTLMDTLRRTTMLREKIRDPDQNASAIAAAAQLVEKEHPEIIAPRKILEAVQAGFGESVARGFEQERRSFAECLATRAARNRIGLFFATRAMTKSPALDVAEPKPIRKAAVVGMGSMGTGIAQALITAGVPVLACDRDESARKRGVERIARSLEKRVEQGRLTREQLDETLALLSVHAEPAELGDAELVIESVFENVEVKRSVLAELEAACPAETVLATNTSTISLDVLAEGMRRAERLVGMHFFNPAHRMPLVEIIRREETSPDVVASAMGLAKRIRKSPVLVNNREGFLVNRIFIPYLKEAFWLLEDGADARAIDAAMVAFGFAMGPLTLIDMAGLDILVDTDEVLLGAFPEHGRISAIARQLVERGHLGQKTGTGVYRYEKGDRSPRDHEAALQIIAETRAFKGVSSSQFAPGDISPETITERLVLRMVREAFCVLEEGVPQRQSDLDAAMVLGTGFPDFRGGPLRYASDLGLDNVRRRLDNLTGCVGERFSPCRLLRDRKE